MEAAIGSAACADREPCAKVSAEAVSSSVRVRPVIDGPLSQQLGDSWAQLAAAAAEPNAFAERWFVEPSLRHLGLPPDLQMLEVWNDFEEKSGLVGLLPVHVPVGYGRIPVRHVQNWTHFHCFLGTPLVRAGHEKTFWMGILRYLDEQRWAAGFLHLKALVEDGPVHRGLIAAASQLGRPCHIVHRSERALLQSTLSPQDYYERTVRKKKRKELKRLSSRLGELGRIEARTLGAAEELEPWCTAFLELEKSGWKGKAGSALGCSASTERFFRDTVIGAFRAGRLDFLRLDLDRRPLAMLINFITPPGSFSFKIAINEDYARFSPGVLIQLENLAVLAREELVWMDSCAAENHPMINSLWAERRRLVRVTVPLAGPVRRATFHVCRALETISALIRTPHHITAAVGEDHD